MSRVATFLTAVTPKGKDIAEAARGIQRLNKSVGILKGDVQSVLARNKNKLWLLIDDIDLAAVDDGGKYDYSACWAIISAAMDLANDFDGVRCMISVRSDIWHVMTKVKRLGSERLDKIKKNTVVLSFNEEELRSMFIRRVELASQAAGAKTIETDMFFADRWLVLPGVQEERRTWDQWIAKNSRDKPRDMVQLVQSLIEEARREKSEKIGDSHAHKIVLEYSKDLVGNISAEYQQICPQIEGLMRFVSRKTLFDFEEIIDLLKRSPSAQGIEIDGIRMKANDKGSAIKLLAILHMANFMNPRVQNGARYDHLPFSTFPDFVSEENWNEMQKAQWEIHPAFHAFVNDTKSSRR
ncbi:hypothetical protein P4115_00010 [Pseudomonas aeruginosa]|nr:hypothetical protein [Pseudomonas aeruginosa]